VSFITRDKNSAINILNLTECWIHNQTRPVEFQFQASSFTCGNKKTGLRNNKQSTPVDFTFFNYFLCCEKTAFEMLKGVNK